MKSFTYGRTSKPVKYIWISLWIILYVLIIIFTILSILSAITSGQPIQPLIKILALIWIMPLGILILTFFIIKYTNILIEIDEQSIVFKGFKKTVAAKWEEIDEIIIKFIPFENIIIVKTHQGKFKFSSTIDNFKDLMQEIKSHAPQAKQVISYSKRFGQLICSRCKVPTEEGTHCLRCKDKLPGEIVEGRKIPQKKKPWLAAVLSLLACGLGQIYNREFSKAFFFIVSIIGVGLLLEKLGIEYGALSIQMLSACEAKCSATRINEAEVVWKLRGFSRKIKRLLVDLIILFIVGCITFGCLKGGLFHLCLGQALCHLKKYDQAIAVYKNYLEHFGIIKEEEYESFKHLVGMVYSDLSLAYIGKGEYDKAISSCKKAIKLYPDYAPAHNNLGWAYYNNKMFTKAIVAYKKAIELAPKKLLPRVNLANVYLELGLIDKAVGEYEKMVHLYPKDPHLRYKLGLLYKESRKIKLAIEEWKKVIKISPKSEAAKAAKKELNELLQRPAE